MPRCAPYLLLLAVLAVFSADAFAQKKTRYMKRLEKMQAEEARQKAEVAPYNSALDRGDSLFRKKEYRNAIGEYEVALREKPGDPFSKAKITDLRILLKLQENPNMTRAEAAELVRLEMEAEAEGRSLAGTERGKDLTDSKVSTPPEAPQPEQPKQPEQPPQPELAVQPPQPEQPAEPEQPKEEQEAPVVPAQPVVDPNRSAIDGPPTSPKKQVVNSQPKRQQRPAQPAAEVTTVANKVMTIEESPNRADGSPYPEGWTEETINGDRMVTVKRVIRQGPKTDVYRKVTHDWGGVFYFKNDLSISESTWMDESKK